MESHLSRFILLRFDARRRPLHRWPRLMQLSLPGDKAREGAYLMQTSRLYLLHLCALISCIALLTVPMRGQTFYGSIVGTIVDSGGSVMPAVEITLTNNGTGAVQRTTTGGDGTYRFVNLPSGVYRLDAASPGFRLYRRDNIRVEVEAAVRADIAMQIGEVAEVVEVTAETPLLQSEKATLSEVVAGRSVQELPLNGRNVLNLVALVPGVVPQGQSMTTITGQNVFSAGNYQIGGGTANQSISFYDGAPTNTLMGNATVLVPSQDVVSEFRVQTSNNSAEYGRFAGGVINLVSKSGTNTFHGTLYEFIRNKKLNATEFFANATGAEKAPFVQNQFGANVGGPIQRDKTFFFAGYEGYRQRQGRLYVVTVPTLAMREGDFSNDRNAQGNVIPIYDALTTCGALNNPNCAAGSVVKRTPFPSNRIPSSRFDPVSKNLLEFPLYAAPNTQGREFTNQFNYSTQTSFGGDNDQVNFRGDHNLSQKQRLFGRYTRWHSRNVAPDLHRNGDTIGAPEDFVTTQAVFGDTYLFSPTSVFDFRASFSRYVYDRIPGNLGLDLTKLGFPSYMQDLPFPTLPRINASGYQPGGTGRIYARNNTYSIVPTLTHISGRHTIKFGGEIRRMDTNYWQNNNTGGTFTFNNLLTSRDPRNAGPTGNSFASFLLGYAASGSIQTSPFTAGGMRYQGYFIDDTWQLSPKLTLNVGIRWETPGVYTERFDRLVTFSPNLPNPVGDQIGRSVPGKLVLVNSPEQPERGIRPTCYTCISPRFGVAYRMSEKAVIRTGAGIFYLPTDTNFPEGPYGHPINQFNNIMASTLDNSLTPNHLLSNPIPNGLIQAPERQPHFQETLLGNNISAPLRDAPYSYAGQWNVALQSEVIGGVVAEASYSGLRGRNLGVGTPTLNQIHPTFMSLGNTLQTLVDNPFFGYIQTGALAASQVQQGQLLRPYPQYSNVGYRGGYFGNSTYHALQVKMEKRMHSGGRILVAHTFSKILTDTETATNWLERGQSSGFQDVWNFRSEKSLSSFDSRRRLVVSYVLDVPVGKGRRFMPNVQGLAGKLMSGWGFNGVSTFQDGFPVGMVAFPNVTGFGTGLRPNVVPGCDPVLKGPAQSRLDGWFNTSCYEVPAPYTFGNASRTDPRVRTHGIANFDFAVFKKTAISERFVLEFRSEFFNLFNRVQFGRPNNQASTAANNTFGFITAQEDFGKPRLMQFALRLSF